MIIGAHSIVYSKKPEADREFFRDVLGLPNVDVGGGWLIFGLPPAELAVHPGKNDVCEFYLMCTDIKTFIAALKKRKIACAPAQDRGWGVLTQLKLPGGGKIGGRSCECARFCTSISEKSIAGATAETGTLPLSAPQTPLNTCCSSPVETIRVKAASGVPTISTPRTNSSGRPSAYTRYTITGNT